LIDRLLGEREQGGAQICQKRDSQLDNCFRASVDFPGWVEEWLGERRAGSYDIAWRCWESRVQGRCSNEGRDKLWGRVYGEKKKKRRRRREGGRQY
jgi:hypothetical protein